MGISTDPSTAGTVAPSKDGVMAVPSKEETVAPSRGGMADKEMEAALYPGKAGRGIPAAGRRQGMVRDGIITRVIIIRSPKRTGRLQGRRHQDDSGADREDARGRGRA